MNAKMQRSVLIEGLVVEVIKLAVKKQLTRLLLAVSGDIRKGISIQ